MKLVTYRFENTQRVGVLTQDETAVLPLDYSDMNTLIETASPADLRSAASAAERAGVRVPLAEVELLAPVPRPRRGGGGGGGGEQGAAGGGGGGRAEGGA